jgi:endonuclease/exonuclease/phosphatase family metal-dependent hydrolase
MPAVCRAIVTFALGLVLVAFSGMRSYANASGLLRVVTYNVAGLPEGISRSSPVANLPLIGEGLNRYDLALIQEDFAYPPLLRQRLHVEHQSKPFVRGELHHFGDGLSTFSKHSFAEPARTAWTRCHGIVDSFFDCLTPKGFTTTTFELEQGVFLDVYNLHMDAGRSLEDRAARRAQLEQLARAVAFKSEGRALLVGGDFNLSRDELASLEGFEQATGARDACRALRCPEPNRIDRVLYRASSKLSLAPTAWRIDHRFLDEHGRPLSDHAAVAVTFRWAMRSSS